MKIEITIGINPFVNAALSRKDTRMPLIESIRIENRGPAIRDAHLKLITRPFLTEFVHPVDLDIGAGAVVSVDVSNVAEVNPAYLLQLSRAYICKVKAVLYVGDDEVIAESDVYNIKLLTCKTWPGCSNHRVLSAFVVTAQPSVGGDTGGLTVSGQRLNAERKAKEIAEIIRAKGMRRINLPAKFIRYPYEFTIYEEFGETSECTSLDMALAFVTLSESVGLKPLIAIHSEGVMAGVWASRPKQGISEDLESEWEGLVNSGEVIEVDPDMLFAGYSGKPLSRATSSGKKGYLESIVDIADSHLSISPISFRLMEHGISNLLEHRNEPEVPFQGLPLRLLGWKARLLDISLANSLVDVGGGSTVKINARNNEQLNVIKTILLSNIPLTAVFDDSSDSEIMSALRENRITIPSSKKSATSGIYRDFNNNLKESGVGGAAMGFGTVVWRDRKDVSHSAPLTLAPVALRKLNNVSYQIRHTDVGGEFFNIVLLERLRNEWGIEIPPLQAFIRNGTIDTGKFLEVLGCACEIDYDPGAYLGIFSLDMNAMWNDLDRNYAKMMENPIIKSLVEGESLDDGGAADISYDLHDLHPVLPLDSSQIAAMNAAVAGRSFILRGPPGTGKSHTICNMICELMLRGKSVLFVSEKIPALEVISNRLREVGVSDYCLSIYGKEKKNQTFVDVLIGNYQRVLENKITVKNEEIDIPTDALDMYYDSMFSKDSNSQSFYGLYNRYLASVSVDAIPEFLTSPPEEVFSYFGDDVGKLDALEASLPPDDIRDVFSGVIELGRDLANVVTGAEHEMVMRALRGMKASIEDLIKVLSICGIDGPLTIGDVCTISKCLDYLTENGLTPSGVGKEIARLERKMAEAQRISKLASYSSMMAKIKTSNATSIADLEKVRDEIDGYLAVTSSGDIGRETIADKRDKLNDDIGSLRQGSEGETWEQFSLRSGYRAVDNVYTACMSGNSTIKDLESAVRQSRLLLDHTDHFYPNFDRKPFTIAKWHGFCEQISGTWPLDMDYEEFVSTLKALSSSIGDAASLLSRAASELNGYEYRKPYGLGAALSRLDKCYREAMLNSFISERMGRYDINSAIKELNAFYDAFESYERSVESVWNKSIHSNADSLREAYKTTTTLLGRFKKKGFMETVNRYAVAPMDYEDFRRNIEKVAVSERKKDYVVDEITNLMRILSKLDGDVERSRRASAFVRLAMDEDPDWKAHIEAGIVPSPPDTALPEIADRAREALAAIGLNGGAVEGLYLSDVIGTIEFAIGERRRSSAADRAQKHSMRLMSELSTLLSSVGEEIGRRIKDISENGTIDLDVPLDSLDLLQKDRDYLDEVIEIIDTSSEYYEALVSGDLNSSETRLDEVVWATDVILNNSKILGQYTSFMNRAKWIDEWLFDELSEMVGSYPRDLIASDMDHAFLGHIVSNMTRKIFGLETYYSGILYGYEEKVRDAYDKLYKRNRENLPVILRDRVRKSKSREFKYLDGLEPSSKGHDQPPIADVLSNIPEILPLIAPCMIMNVQSVSRYLDIHSLSFDYVIFDESSQIPTEDAVASISRGRTCIIVGDANQLPPTSFFKNTVVDYVKAADETESILEECAFNNMPSLRLDWHYRSNHESLIAFSNNEFYNNSLITFPSVTDRVSRVSFEYVAENAYQRGKGANTPEAERVVDILYDLCSDPGTGRSSIGIVTFGSGQMDEIGRVLEQRLEKEPHLVVESKIKSRKEPLFIKNLESIQGEERSIIIISVGYGRDKSGKLVMNFGPLNQSRGWRRLNVAISRARDRMIVCSSIHSSDIAVTEKTGKSILELKGFLEYAETGRFDRKISSADVIDPILPAIADKVRALGYEVALNIGKSELRIDIAVVDPDNRDSYCLAILLDRNLYDNSRNPVDRDYTKYRFLKKMGWNVLRVYTLDWLTDEDFVMDMIKDNLPKRRTGPYRRIRGVRY